MADAGSDAPTTAAGDDAVEASETLVREPQQARSRKTLRRIVEASFHILEQEGPDALTVTGITKRARTSVGSFYARFQGKEDLLRYLGERSLEQSVEEWEELRAKLASNGDLRRSVSEIVTGLSWLYLEGAGRPLVMLDGIEDPGPTRRRRLEDRIAADVQSVLAHSEVRSNLATRIVTGVLHDVGLRSRGGPGLEESSPYPHTPILLSELVELVVGYLGGEVQAPAPEAEAERPAPAEPTPKPEPATRPEPAPEPEAAAAEEPEASELEALPTSAWDQPAGELQIPHEWEPEPEPEEPSSAEWEPEPDLESPASAEEPEPEPPAEPEPTPAEASVEPVETPESAQITPPEPATEAAAEPSDEPEEPEPPARLPPASPAPESTDEAEPDPFDVWG